MPLSDIPGQPRAVAALQSALASHSVHHAYLFAGPSGVGKEATAIALAQALLCGVQPDQGCGTCLTCTRVAKLGHPDVTLVLPEDEQVRRGRAGRSDFDHVPSREIRVEQIRLLQERLSFRGLESKRKFVLIALAEQMNPQAQNALLKTLEEPPPDTTIALVCSAPDRLLSTVRSRCSRLQFGPLPEAMLMEALGAGKTLDAGTAGLLATLAGGSLTRALEMDPEQLADRKELYTKFEAMTAEDLRTVLRFSEAFGASRDAAEAALQLLTVWLRDLALLQAGSEQIANRDLLELARSSAAKRSPESLHRSNALVEKARFAITVRNGGARLQLERMLLEMGEG